MVTTTEQQNSEKESFTAIITSMQRHLVDHMLRFDNFSVHDKFGEETYLEQVSNIFSERMIEELDRIGVIDQKTVKDEDREYLKHKIEKTFVRLERELKSKIQPALRQNNCNSLMELYEQGVEVDLRTSFDLAVSSISSGEDINKNTNMEFKERVKPPSMRYENDAAKYLMRGYSKFLNKVEQNQDAQISVTADSSKVGKFQQRVQQRREERESSVAMTP